MGGRQTGRGRGARRPRPWSQMPVLGAQWWSEREAVLQLMVRSSPSALRGVAAEPCAPLNKNKIQIETCPLDLEGWLCGKPALRTVTNPCALALSPSFSCGTSITLAAGGKR